MQQSGSRLPQVQLDEIDDPELLAVIERAERLSTPKPAWYLTLAHDPEMAKAYAAYWDLTHRGGRVEHTTKELMRIAIASLLDCKFCASQRSARALEEGLDEAQAVACSLPDFDPPDARARAAVRYARVLALARDDTSFDAAYAELRSVFTEAGNYRARLLRCDRDRWSNPLEKSPD